MKHSIKDKTEFIRTKLNLLLKLFKKYLALLLVMCIAGGLGAGIITYCIYTPEYTVTRAFTIELEKHPGANYATISENQLSKTIPSLLSSDTFQSYMKEYMDQSGVKGTFRITSLEYSNIFYLTVMSDSNESCNIIIDEIQKRYSGIADKVVGESTMKFMAPPSYSSLPSNAPNYTIGIIIGILAMLLIFTALLVLKAVFTQTVTSAHDIEEEGNFTCLATVHRVYHKKRSGESKKDFNRIPLVTDGSAGLDLCRDISTLSANTMRLCADKDFNTLLVTSTAPGEGKSSVSLNLACDLADKGKRVIIIDFDLRAPCIAERLGITNVPVTLTDAIKNGNNCIVETDIPNLYFSGNVQDGTAELNRNDFKKLSEIIENFKSGFDYVIIDTPPSGFFGDAIEIGELADSFIYVISYNSISKNSVMRSLSSFDDSHCQMLGFVLNFA